FTGSNLAGLLPNLITTNEAAAGWLSIPLGWVAPAALEDAGFAAAVDVSMASDQAGFSYAHQLSFLVAAAPYFIDYAITMFNILDPTDFNKTETAFNNAYGSANPNDTG